MAVGIDLTREPGGRLVVQVTGTLDEPGGKELARVVRDELEDAQIRAVLFDLRGLRGSEILGRAQLRELQEAIKKTLKRTAYVTATPRMRGMTNIVIHGADDENAATFVTRVEAEAWLEDTSSRKALNLLVAEKHR